MLHCSMAFFLRLANEAVHFESAIFFVAFGLASCTLISASHTIFWLLRQLKGIITLQ
jgi:hypothetical protein